MSRFGFGVPSSSRLVSSQQSTAAPSTTFEYPAGYTLFVLGLTLSARNYIRTVGFDFRQAATVNIKIAQRTGAGAFNVVYVESFSHGGSGFEDFTLATPYLIPASGNYHIGVHHAFGSFRTVGETTSGASRAYKSENPGLGATSGYTEDAADMVASRVNFGL